MLRFQKLLFTCIFYVSIVWFGITSALISCLPFTARFRYLTLWNRLISFSADILLGLRVNVIGAENIPKQACVVMCKHQSEWETIYLQTLISPLCTILKVELFKIPFFGWALRQLEPIAINRSAPKEALRQVKQQGMLRLDQGRFVLLFPEGTRVVAGEQRKYARSGADLALSAATDILPVAHNAGLYWPKGKSSISPGTINVVIGELIATENKSAKQITQEVEEWIESHSKELLVNAPASSLII